MHTTTLVAILIGCADPDSDAPGSDADPTDPSGPSDPSPDGATDTGPAPVQVRFATFNVSMYRASAGALAADLATGTDPQALAAAAILQQVRPDVLLVEEFDHDADGAALDAFVDRYLAVGQDGRAPLAYPYRWSPPVNTGEPSGFDLDNDGTVTATPGSEAYGDDCFGFGTYPGQYGLAVLSTFPIAPEDGADIRTFRTLRWRDLPGADLPPGWFTDDELEVVRLSSKTHADVPTVHFLVSHPTPPTFDGPEDRNGRRNHDELSFWLRYLDGGAPAWLVDDDGRPGAAADAPFVLAGDFNNDPNDGYDIATLPAGVYTVATSSITNIVPIPGTFPIQVTSQTFRKHTVTQPGADFAAEGVKVGQRVKFFSTVPTFAGETERFATITAVNGDSITFEPG
ncbi:MAG: endonuclease/exonuclease/phosphatase family protein, partial [Myxococcota bacterium]